MRRSLSDTPAGHTVICKAPAEHDRKKKMHETFICQLTFSVHEGEGRVASAPHNVALSGVTNRPDLPFTRPCDPEPRQAPRNPPSPTRMRMECRGKRGPWEPCRRKKGREGTGGGRNRQKADKSRTGRGQKGQKEGQNGTRKGHRVEGGARETGQGRDRERQGKGRPLHAQFCLTSFTSPHDL